VSKYKKEVIDWQKVQEDLFNLYGKKYTLCYIMGVRSGNNGNKTIYKFLEDNGLLK
jgi:hypothetical protein